MKIINRIYAESLIDSLAEEKSHPKIAKNLWRILQKNKQYQNLDKILEETENILALRENKKIAYIYSETILSLSQQNEITAKLTKLFGSEVILKNIIDKKAVGGIKIKCDGEYLDLTLLNKVTELKKALSKE